MVTTNFEAGAEGESDDFATAIGADSAGRVVALGFTCCNGLGYRRFAVARYTSGGVLDSTFGSGGLAATAFGSSDAVAFTGLVDGSGRPVAAGYVCCDPTYDLALARWQGGNGAATDRPNTILDSTPDPLTNDTEPDFTFHSTKANSTFECKLYAGTGDGSGVTWEDCDSPHQADALGSDGDYTFKVRAIDANGIHDESPAVATFTLDATAPETILSLPPWGPDGDPDAYVWHSPFPTFTFYSFEPATFRCRIDTGAWTSCGHTESDTDLVDYTAPTALSNGPHTFRVAASDDLGNEDPTPEVATFTVAAGADHDPPDLTILAGTSRLSSSGVATVLLLCPNTEVSGPCTGKLGLKTTKKFGGRKVKLGNASYSIPSGEGDAVQIQLGSKQRALVAKHSPLAAKASTKVSDSAGNSKKVSQALKLSKP